MPPVAFTLFVPVAVVVPSKVNVPVSVKCIVPVQVSSVPTYTFTLSPTAPVPTYISFVFNVNLMLILPHRQLYHHHQVIPY